MIASLQLSEANHHKEKHLITHSLPKAIITEKPHPVRMRFFLVKGRKKRYFREFSYRLEPVYKINALRLGEKLHQHLFTITYYLPRIDNVVLVKSEELRVKK